MSQSMISAVHSYANLKNIDYDDAFEIIMSAYISFEDDMQSMSASRGEYHE